MTMVMKRYLKPEELREKKILSFLKQTAIIWVIIVIIGGKIITPFSAIVPTIIFSYIVTYVWIHRTEDKILALLNTNSGYLSEEDISKNIGKDLDSVNEILRSLVRSNHIENKDEVYVMDTSQGDLRFVTTYYRIKQ